MRHDNIRGVFACCWLKNSIVLDVDNFASESSDSLFNLLAPLFEFFLPGFQIIWSERNWQTLKHAVQLSLGAVKLLKRPNSLLFINLTHARWQCSLSPQLLSFASQIFGFFLILVQIFGHFSKVFVLLIHRSRLFLCISKSLIVFVVLFHLFLLVLLLLKLVNRICSLSLGGQVARNFGLNRPASLNRCSFEIALVLFGEARSNTRLPCMERLSRWCFGDTDSWNSLASLRSWRQILGFGRWPESHHSIFGWLILLYPRSGLLCCGNSWSTSFVVIMNDSCLGAFIVYPRNYIFKLTQNESFIYNWRRQGVKV